MKRLFLFTSLIIFPFIIFCQNSFNNYNQLWDSVTLFGRKQLPKSAIEKVNKIYDMATSEKRYDQLIKSLIYKVEYNRNEENGDMLSLEMLQKESSILPFPAKNFVEGLLAQFYLEYYQNNSWTINERTVLKEESTDFETWDALTFRKKILQHCNNSLKDAEKLQQLPSISYEALLIKDSLSPQLRPTLYDLLAQQIIEMLDNRYYFSTYNESFKIDDSYFSNTQTFANQSIPKTDILSFNYHILSLYQQLLRFHLDKNNIEPIIDLELNRLKFVRNKTQEPNTEKSYEYSLSQLAETYKANQDCGNILYELAFLYNQQGNDKKLYRSRFIEAYTLCEQIEKEYPKSLVAEKHVLNLKKDILTPNITAQMESVILPNKTTKIFIGYRNIDKAYLRIYKAYALGLDDINFYDRNDFTKKLKLIKDDVINLPLQNDYQNYSTEAKLDGLPVGKYILVISNTPENTENSVQTIFKLSISNLISIEKNEGKQLNIMALDRKTGAAVHKAKVEMIKKKDKQYTVLSTAYTNEQGMCYLQCKDYCEFRITYKNDTLIKATNNYQDDVTENTHYKTLFFTDRAIYRPGQTVYWKGILLKEENKKKTLIVSDKKVKIEFLDVNWRKIAEQTFTSNEFGSFNGSFTIPAGLLNGQMCIKSEYGQQYIRVEEYKRPTFEVKLNPLKEEAQFNTQIKLTGIAQALAGYVVDNANVSYRITRLENLIRYWMPHNEIQVTSGETNTNEKGEFSISFLADDMDINKRSIYSYTVSVDVTDLNGETQSNKIDIQISKTPLIIKTNLPEKVNTNSELLFDLSTTSLNGENIRSNIDIEILALESPAQVTRERLGEIPDTFSMSYTEYKKYFPNDVYKEEDKPKNFEIKEKITSILYKTSDNKKLDLSILKQHSSGWYKVYFKATSEKGTIVEDSIFICLTNGKPTSITSMKDWFYDYNKSSLANIGDELKFDVAGGEKKSYLFYEITSNGNTLKREYLNIGTSPTSITIAVLKEYLPEFSIQFFMQQENRSYEITKRFRVEDSTDKLKIEFVSFREKLKPGEKEEWKLRIQSKDNQKQAAEVLATLYDASLDIFTIHQFEDYNYWNSYHYNNVWDINNYSNYDYGFIKNISRSYLQEFYRKSDKLLGINAFNKFTKHRRSKQMSLSEDENIVMEQSASEGGNLKSTVKFTPPVIAGMRDLGTDEYNENSLKETMPLEQISIRKNFNETAFFYPELRTNAEGEISIEFTIPEALTRWKMLGFTHTKDFKTGIIENSLITQKEIAITANEPRFVREGDMLVFSAKVNNLTKETLKGLAMLRLFNASTGESIESINLTAQTQNIALQAEQSTVVKWILVIPVGLQAIEYKLTAQAGQHTDGESKIIPVLTNSMLVTESMPFSVRATQSKKLTFEHLKNNASKTLRNESLTLEFTSNPAWYAVQALPYLMEYPYDCAEQIFSRFYANSLASNIVNSSPKIKQIFELWKNLPNSDALLSALEKNQELKQVLLEETPWVLQAQKESERKRNIALLFDLNKMSNELQSNFNKLKNTQLSDGAFPWFKGSKADRYITQYIITGLSRLQKQNILDNSYKLDVVNIKERAYSYLDEQLKKDYDQLIQEKKNLKEQQIQSIQLYYLYGCSLEGRKPNDNITAAYNFYLEQAKTFWTKQSLYNQALTSLILHRTGDKQTALDILKSLKERSLQSEEMGMYWKENTKGYFWNEAPIETQALLIEVFNEIANDQELVDEMRIWLLRNKQTNAWNSTKSTTEAIYALLMNESSLLNENQLLDIKVDNKPLNEIAREEIQPEAGTGYAKTSWKSSDIRKNMANIEVRNPNTKGIAWGAMYWQYFEQLDKIVSAETNLKIKKQLYRKTNKDKEQTLETITAETPLKVGDLVTVRMELRADRNFEYVHLKDLRAAGFEPTSTLSGYQYQQGLSYYQNIKDVSVNFFISYLPKGTYVFEYDVRVTHSGEFSNGITTFQCMYAPEFSAHTNGERVNIIEQ